MKDNESFVFYKSFLEAVNEIPDDRAKLETLLTIINYGLYCEEPKEKTSTIAKMAFKFVKPQIDVNLERRKNGQKGGRGHKRETNGLEPENHRLEDDKPMVNSSETNGLEDDNHTFESTKPNVNVNGKVDGNVNVNAYVDVKGTGIRRPTIPPTLDEVYELFNGMGLHGNPDEFFDYYDDNSWKYAKTGRPLKTRADLERVAKAWSRKHTEFADKAEEKIRGKVVTDVDYSVENEDSDNNIPDWLDEFVNNDDEVVKDKEGNSVYNDLYGSND